MSAKTQERRDAARLVAAASWRVTPAGYGLRLLPGFQLWRHVALISREFVWAMTTPGARLIVNLQNQVGKSQTTSICGPIWLLDHWPHLRIMLLSYGIDFSAKWGQRTRDIISANGEHLSVKVRGDFRAPAADWETTAGGGLLCSGFGGSITGRPADRLIIDDPHKNWQEAHSQTMRDRVWDEWRGSVIGRLQPESSVVVTMTRYHEDDFTGRLTNPSVNEDWHRWRVVRLPALAEVQDDPLDREIGEVLEPRRFDLAEMESRKKSVGSYFWAGMYQQRPAPAEGGIIKRDWWRYYRQIPHPTEFDEVIQSWDMSFKDHDESDYVVGTVWGRIGARKYLLDIVRDRMEFTDAVKAVVSLSGKWPNAKAKLVEDAANGPAVISTLKTTVSGLIPYPPRGSKPARTRAVTPDIEAGNVFLPDPSIAPWVHDFIEETAAFPNGSHDDQVDSMSQALDRLGSSALTQPKPYRDMRGRR